MAAAGWSGMMVEVLVTGGAGFIGSNFVRHALEAHQDWRITTLDKLTYAGRMETLKDVIDHPRHRFVQDRKSTRLNSSHSQISYAVFCLKKKKKQKKKT